MGTKWINRDRKIWRILEKYILVILLVIVLLGKEVWVNFKSIELDRNSISIISKDIQYYELDLASFDKKINSAITETSLVDYGYMDYNSWGAQIAAKVNGNIYSKTDYLTQLNLSKGKANKGLTIIDNKDYGELVKFLIIDKAAKTYITNDDTINDYAKEQINLIKNGKEPSLSEYINEDKDIFCFISKDSSGSPFYTYEPYDTIQISNPKNYIEAYWLPKRVKLTVKSKSIIDEVLKAGKADITKKIEDQNRVIGIYNTEINKYTKITFIYVGAIILLLVLLSIIGWNKVSFRLRYNFITKIYEKLNGSFETLNNLLKFSLFLAFTSLFFPLIFLLRTKISYNKGLSLISILTLIMIFVIRKAIKYTLYLQSIIKGANIITSGNIEYVIEEKGDKSLVNLAHNINKINHGFKVSIEEQIKNERLKSELVANVSHDLKTPLTSIINYTDILAREDLTEEEKKKYIDILSKKSLKLKKLIEDLFEISKINSGKMELSRTVVDVVELINQAIIEYSDTEIYSNKNISFMVKTFAPKINIELDGNKISRVFENLINNILKYSLPNTRGFVEVEEINRGIKVYFKSTSAAALDFDKEEILERFTRGDKSRNSDIEGSGLGLAISKSIVELHGGKLYVDFDGDLFKVVIELFY